MYAFFLIYVEAEDLWQKNVVSKTVSIEAAIIIFEQTISFWNYDNYGYIFYSFINTMITEFEKNISWLFSSKFWLKNTKWWT